MKEKTKVIIILIFVIILIIIGMIFWYKKENIEISSFTISDERDKINSATEFGDDVVGWVRVEGTNIDMALIQTNNEVDVTKDDYDFAWTNSFPDSKSNHLNFISHNIRNVSSNPVIGDDSMKRFEQLMSFIYPDFINKNQFIEITDKSGKSSLYRIYAVSLTEDDQSESYNDTYTLKEQASYIKKAKKESMYDMSVDVKSNDMLLTLYTCTRFYGLTTNYSFKVEARKLRDNEKKNYVVAKPNDNYKVIEDKMKEVEEDEKI